MAQPGAFVPPCELRVKGVEGLPLDALVRGYADAVPGGVVRETADEAELVFEFVQKGVPDSDEGYELVVAPTKVVVRARDVRGLFYGLQSFCWLLRDRRAEGVACCRIRDWPDSRIRGLFLELNKIPASSMPRLCQVLDALAALKYNTVLCDFADNFPLSISDEFVRESTFSREDIEAFKAAAKRNFITIIPKVQFVSHTWWMTRHRDWEELREGVPSIPWNSAYCPRNPRMMKIVVTMVKEMVALLNPPYFHLGLDEMQGCPHGVCPRCEGTPPADLLLEHVLPIQRYLLKHGVTPIVYQDEFCESIPTRGQTNFVAALDKMDRRVLVNLWQYEAWPSAAQYAEIARRGFKGVFMSWHNNILNTMNLPRLSAKVGGEGCILAYWLNLAATMDDTLRAGCEAYPATVYQALYSWNAAAPDIYRLPFDAHVVLKRLLDPERLPAFSAARRPLSLDGVFNARLGGPGRRYPSLDAASAARLAKGAAADDARFAVAADGARLKAVALAGSERDAALPGEVRIPVRGRAEGFSFLVAAAPENAWLFRPMQTDKPTVGRLALVYADGSREELPLLYQYSINQWNAPTGAYEARVVARATDTERAVANLYAVDWKNPSPEKDVEAIVFSSERHEGVSLLLFAASAFGELATTAETSAKPTALVELSDGPEPTFVPLVDFAKKDAMKNVVITSSDGGLNLGYKTKIVRDEAGRKVLEVRLPALPAGKSRRFCIDVPLAADFDLNTFQTDVYCDKARFITRPDLYVAGSSGCLTAIDFGRGFTDGWTRLQVPVSVFRGREGNGAARGDYKFIRVAFYLENTEPVVLRFGRFAASTSPAPGRFDVRAELK